MKTKTTHQVVKPHLAEHAQIFGENMRIARKERGISTNTMASFLGLSATYIGLIERGERTPGFEVFLRICEFFGESGDKMLTKNPNPPYPLKGKGMNKIIKEPEETNSIENQLLLMKKTINGLVNAFSDKELDFVIEVLKGLKVHVTNK